MYITEVLSIIIACKTIRESIATIFCIVGLLSFFGAAITLALYASTDNDFNDWYERRLVLQMALETTMDIDSENENPVGPMRS